MTATINGYRIIIDHGHAKLRIRDHVPCTESVRNEINAWLAATFGFRHVVPKDEVIVDDNLRFLFMRPEMYAALRASGVVEEERHHNPNDRWYDFTVVGSSFEQQHNPHTGQWRHRRRSVLFDSGSVARGPWAPGPAPRRCY